MTLRRWDAVCNWCGTSWRREQETMIHEDAKVRPRLVLSLSTALQNQQRERQQRARNIWTKWIDYAAAEMERGTPKKTPNVTTHTHTHAHLMEVKQRFAYTKTAGERPSTLLEAIPLSLMRQSPNSHFISSSHLATDYFAATLFRWPAVPFAPPAFFGACPWTMAVAVHAAPRRSSMVTLALNETL